MDDVRIHPAPAQPGGPPIVVAGRSEAAMRRAATLGDGWLPYLYSPRRYAASVETIRSAAAEAGRDLSEFGWYVWVFVNVDPDGDAAREQAARSMGGTYDQDFRSMVDNVAAAGTPDEVMAKLQAFYDAGARHFIFSPATAGADPHGHRPALRRRGSRLARHAAMSTATGASQHRPVGPRRADAPLTTPRENVMTIDRSRSIAWTRPSESQTVASWP